MDHNPTDRKYRVLQYELQGHHQRAPFAESPPPIYVGAYDWEGILDNLTHLFNDEQCSQVCITPIQWRDDTGPRETVTTE